MTFEWLEKACDQLEVLRSHRRRMVGAMWPSAGLAIVFLECKKELARNVCRPQCENWWKSASLQMAAIIVQCDLRSHVDALSCICFFPLEKQLFYEYPSCAHNDIWVVFHWHWSTTHPACCSQWLTNTPPTRWMIALGFVILAAPKFNLGSIFFKTMVQNREPKLVPKSWPSLGHA